MKREDLSPWFIIRTYYIFIQYTRGASNSNIDHAEKIQSRLEQALVFQNMHN